MDTENILARLLDLAEKQQQNIDNLHNHVLTLEQIVQAQQRTIDTLSAMAQPIVINGNGTTIDNRIGVKAENVHSVNCDLSNEKSIAAE